MKPNFTTGLTSNFPADRRSTAQTSTFLPRADGPFPSQSPPARDLRNQPRGGAPLPVSPHGGGDGSASSPLALKPSPRSRRSSSPCRFVSELAPLRRRPAAEAVRRAAAWPVIARRQHNRADPFELHRCAFRRGSRWCVPPDRSSGAGGGVAGRSAVSSIIATASHCWRALVAVGSGKDRASDDFGR